MKIIRRLFLFIILVVIIVFLLLDNIVKYSIEKYGSKALATTVSVEALESSVLQQNISINKITIANPTGFEGNVLTIGNTAVQIAKIDDIIEIDSIDIEDVMIHMVQNANGINLVVFKDKITTQSNNYKSYQNTRNNSYENTETRIKINALNITNNIVIVDTDIAKEQIVLPDITLSNIGGDKGMLISELTSYIIKHLVKEITTTLSTKGIGILENGLGQIFKNLDNSLGVDINNIEDVGNALKNSLGGSKEELQQKTNDLQNELNEQKEKLKNIFKF